MATTDENKIKTGKSVDGKWLWEGKERGKNIQLEVIITRDTLTIQHGEEMVFKMGKPIPTDAHWFGDYLVFLDTLYFARYADADVLLFGELKHRYNNVVWEKEFKRIKPWK